MTDNHTSRVVHVLLNRRRSGEENPFDGLSYDDVLKIAEKYERMEEAFESILLWGEASTCEICGKKPMKETDAYDYAKQALAFDPLNQ